LEENVGAASVKLSGDEMQRLDEALKPEAVAGPRYNAHYQALIDR
jgi:aryl-alcohol dehydrogenase-like predicted oxidoreductase